MPTRIPAIVARLREAAEDRVWGAARGGMGEVGVAVGADVERDGYTVGEGGATEIDGTALEYVYGAVADGGRDDSYVDQLEVGEVGEAG